MKSCWFIIVLMLGFIVSVPTINGDTYHYRVLRRICPAGSYHDPIKDRCRKVPGGGSLIKYNLDARCSNRILGLLAHSRNSQYYFVCQRDAVLTCTCGPKEVFSKIRLRCEKRRKSITIQDSRSHYVVDRIVEKYKCVGQSEQDFEVQPLRTTEASPFQMIDDRSYEQLLRLHEILQTFIRSPPNSAETSTTPQGTTKLATKQRAEKSTIYTETSTVRDIRSSMRYPYEDSETSTVKDMRLFLEQSPKGKTHEHDTNGKSDIENVQKNLINNLSKNDDNPGENIIDKTEHKATSKESDESYESGWFLKTTTNEPHQVTQFKDNRRRFQFQQTVTEMFPTEASPTTLQSATKGPVVPKLKLKFESPVQITTESRSFRASSTITSTTKETPKVNLKGSRQTEQPNFQRNKTLPILPNKKSKNDESIENDDYIEYYEVYEYYDSESPNITLFQVEKGTTQVVKLTTTDDTFSTDTSTTESSENEFTTRNYEHTTTEASSFSFLRTDIDDTAMATASQTPRTLQKTTNSSILDDQETTRDVTTSTAFETSTATDHPTIQSFSTLGAFRLKEAKESTTDLTTTTDITSSTAIETSTATDYSTTDSFSTMGGFRIREAEESTTDLTTTDITTSTAIETSTATDYSTTDSFSTMGEFRIKETEESTTDLTTTTDITTSTAIETSTATDYSTTDSFSTMGEFRIREAEESTTDLTTTTDITTSTAIETSTATDYSTTDSFSTMGGFRIREAEESTTDLTTTTDITTSTAIETSTATDYSTTDSFSTMGEFRIKETEESTTDLRTTTDITTSTAIETSTATDYSTTDSFSTMGEFRIKETEESTTDLTTTTDITTSTAIETSTATDYSTTDSFSTMGEFRIKETEESTTDLTTTTDITTSTAIETSTATDYSTTDSFSTMGGFRIREAEESTTDLTTTTDITTSTAIETSTATDYSTTDSFSTMGEFRIKETEESTTDLTTTTDITTSTAIETSTATDYSTTDSFSTMGEFRIKETEESTTDLTTTTDITTSTAIETSTDFTTNEISGETTTQITTAKTVQTLHEKSNGGPIQRPIDYLSIQPKKEDIEYYYVYEDYDADNDDTFGPKPSTSNITDFVANKSKQKSDNSFEYYVESISASREYRKNPSISNVNSNYYQ